MRKWLPRIVLLLALIMLISGTALAIEEEEEPVAVPEEAAKMSKAPPITDIVQRYNRKWDDQGIVEAYRPTIYGNEFVVSGCHFTVCQVVYDIFERGGNIWDAAIPGMWMTEVAGGQMSPGTAVFDMYVAAESKALSYCGVGTAPALGTVDYFIERFGDKILDPDTGEHFVPMMNSRSKANENWLDDQWVRQLVCPSPDNMIALLSRFGTMSWAEAIQPALELMEDGWPLSASYGRYPESASLFQEPRASDPSFNANRMLWRGLGPTAKYGLVLKEPGLARTIRGMMTAEAQALQLGATREEALRAARDWYYLGPIAREIDRMNRENNGMVRYEDYANYEGRWYEGEELPHTTFMGVDFYTDGTYTQAGLLILVLNIIQNWDLVALGWNTPEYIHVITQAFDLAFADRWQYFGDPLFHEMPENLWSKEYGTLRAGLIDMKWRFQEAPPPGDPANMKAVLEGWTPFVPPSAITGPEAVEPDLSKMVAAVMPEDSMDEGIADTIFTNIIDKHGNVFTYCPSDGRTSAAQVPGYGVAITRRGRQFTLGDWPHSIEPGKRPVSTPHGWVAAKDGVGLLTAQTPGGDSQVQCGLPIMLNYLVWNMPAQVAIEQPRFETRNLYSMFTPYVANYKRYAGYTRVDDAIPEETLKALEAMGHKIQIYGPWAVGSRPMFIVRDPETGLVMGGSGVKGEGYCFGK